MHDDLFDWKKIPQPDFDWAASIELAHGQADIAKQLCTMLLDGLDQFSADIQSAHEQNNQEKLREHVHKLHGGLCYLGAPKLRYLARHLETACKQNNTTQINEITPPFLKAMIALKHKLQEQVN
jgi:two-component system, NarL family, sensor histidine kinase BarA